MFLPFAYRLSNEAFLGCLASSALLKLGFSAYVLKAYKLIFFKKNCCSNRLCVVLLKRDFAVVMTRFWNNKLRHQLSVCSDPCGRDSLEHGTFQVCAIIYFLWVFKFALFFLFYVATQWILKTKDKHWNALLHLKGFLHQATTERIFCPPAVPLAMVFTAEMKIYAR